MMTSGTSSNLRRDGEAVDDAGHLLQVVSAAAEGTGQPAAQALAALVALRRLRDRLEAWEPELIEAARAAGASWAELAPALGVASRQAAERRYLRARTPGRPESELTRDERVQAERDRRAGNRAVSVWARRHGADLRQLAGQITALTNLGAEAQPSLDRLHQALGGDDAAELVALLAAAHRHLPDALADRVDAVTSRTDEIRRDEQRHRDESRAREAAVE
jgi:hypothetical protein